MPSSPWLDRLQRGLIVSCQAPADSPLHAPEIISAIALAAVQRGAIGIRLDTPAHVRAVRSTLAAAGRSVPIIGLWKQVIPGSEVYITPQVSHAEAIIAAGAEIVAIDGTLRPRPGGETVADLIAAIHGAGRLVMADVDTIEAAIAAEAAGADLVGTTLYGYTEATRAWPPPGWELLTALVDRLTVPAICEGGIGSPAQAQRAIDSGAWAVVVGTAITGIDLQVQAYCAALQDRP